VKIDTHVDWTVANQARLASELARLRERLEAHAAGSATGAHDPAPPREPSTPDGSAIDRLTATFGLTSFERDVVLLCAGMELDAAFAQACRAASREAGPTWSLALAALEGAHWSALTPGAPVRYWRLVEGAPADTLVAARLRLDERILHFLAGVPSTDARLQGLVRRHRSTVPLSARQRDVAAGMVALWRGADARGARWPAVQLVGADDAGAEDTAQAAFEEVGLALGIVRVEDLPPGAVERREFFHLWDRESALTDTGLLILADDADPPESIRSLTAFAHLAQSPVVLAGRDPFRAGGRELARFELHKPPREEQAVLWRRALEPALARLATARPPVPDGAPAPPGNATSGSDELVRRITAQFSLGPAAIATAGALVEREDLTDLPALGARLWTVCRSQARVRLDDLAERVESSAGWADLVLPEAQRDILDDILVHVRHGVEVYERWGFAGRSSRGLGVSVLFSGPSGTGKTLAAEIVANRLELDLYRIDLSQIVSKYIGETEKNLRRVFDAAETSGAVLLFDEADALFGKRSEVKDSHDRYANIEVSYLLQLMESYRGLAILTTNMKQALDPAFKRRIRFVVQFPFPEASERAEIWRRVFPRETPLGRIDVDALSRLNVAGGNIRNIALGAAFLAADERAPVAMKHLLRMARAECAKLERPLTDAEIGGWV
jgi:ATPase family associated with various cellular activities (AAA)